jgi:hypothetical protein
VVKAGGKLAASRKTARVEPDSGFKSDAPPECFKLESSNLELSFAR